MISDYSHPGIGARLGGAVRLMGFLGLSFLLIPVQLVCEHILKSDPSRVSRNFYGLLVRVLGFRLRTHGAPTAASPVLFVANHTSYLDIPVLGALLPASFVAKSDVASWPFFGFMAKFQHTVFIERRAVRARDQRDLLNGQLINGKNLILFPEGTSTDGLTVLPFKSSLFSIVEHLPDGKPVTIQPVSVAATELDGLPLIRDWRPFYAWYGDMTLLGHLWDVFTFGRFTVDVVFHPPIAAADFPDRKTLAAYCQQQVARGIERCLTGRGIPSGEPIHLSAPAVARLS